MLLMMAFYANPNGLCVETDYTRASRMKLLTLLSILLLIEPYTLPPLNLDGKDHLRSASFGDLLAQEILVLVLSDIGKKANDLVTLVNVTQPVSFSCQL